MSALCQKRTHALPQSPAEKHLLLCRLHLPLEVRKADITGTSVSFGFRKTTLRQANGEGPVVRLHNARCVFSTPRLYRKADDDE